MAARPILIAGMPRSGTTWIGSILAKPHNTCYVFEPDNEKIDPTAYFIKKYLHRFPCLKNGEVDSRYYKLWQLALSRKNNLGSGIIYSLMKRKDRFTEEEVRKRCGFVYRYNNKGFSALNVKTLAVLNNINIGIYSLMSNYFKIPLCKRPKRLVIKTVHSILSLPWIVNNFNPVMVVVVRHPFSVIASHLRLNMPDGERNIVRAIGAVDDGMQSTISKINSTGKRIERVGIQIAIMKKYIEKFLREYPECILVKHEEFCAKPEDKFKELFEQLELTWNEKIVEYINSLNRPGDGFHNKRISVEQIDKWKSQISDSDVEILNNCFKKMGVSIEW